MLSATLLPTAAFGYPGTVDSFASGASNATVSIPFPLRAQFAGTVEILSNATVESASVQLSGEAFQLPSNFTHTGLAGFPAGANDTGLSVLPTGLALALRNGSTEFSGAAFDFGTFTNTLRVGSDVVLTTASGSYTSPDIPWNGASYGRLIANVLPGLSATTSYSIVDASGTVLQIGLKPGALITVNGSLTSPIRIRVSLTAPSVAASPAIKLLGAGYALADYLGPSAASVTLTALGGFGGGLGLKESFFNWTESGSNPIIGQGAAGTWWARGYVPRTAVNVGSEIWLYVTGLDGSGVAHIGRVVSADGGASWTADGSTVMDSTAATWDSAWVDAGSVLPDGSGGFKMWYFGASSIDQFRIGYATSADGIAWTKYASNPVMSQSGGSAWDNWNVGWNKVVKVGSTYTMLYAGRLNTDARKSIGLATSTDGISWAKSGSNPVISYGSTSAGAYDINPNDLVYDNGTYYLYWTCAPGASSYDTCVSTSSNGVSWTHFNLNPVITHGDGAWDSVTAEATVRMVDPASGRALMLFTGRGSSVVYSVGRADPKRESPGTYSALWNLSGERPHMFLTHTLANSAPAGTSLAPSLQTSTNNLSFAAAESLLFSDSLIVSQPQNYLRYTVNLSSSDLRYTPTIFSSRLTYDRYLTHGEFVSAPTPEPYPIDNVTLNWSSSVPAGTSAALWVSNDNGSTWRSASPGVLAAFASPGFVFRYRVVLDGTTALSPLVQSLTGSLGVDSTPTDVELRGADGTLIVQAPGVLLAARALLIDPSWFNTRIQLSASSDPPIPLDFDLLVNASTAGLVHIDWVRLNATYPDLLRTHFAPEGSSVVMELGQAQNFRAVASTTPGVPITYAWFADGALSSETGDLFTFYAAPGSVGNHTVTVSVSNGQFTNNQTWTVTVLPRPVYLVASFYPGVHAVEVPVGLLQQFFASVASAVLAPSIAWALDGSAAGNTTEFDYTAPADAGLHVLRVEVTNGVDTLSWEWNITVTAVPSAPSRQIAMTFDPASNVSLDIGAVQAFFANFTGTAPAGVRFEWRLDGEVTGGNVPSYTYTASSAGLGTHALTVLARNDSALAAHSWTLTVLAPPPLPPSITISTPANGAVSDASTIVVEGTVSPGATVFVAGLEAAVSPAGRFHGEVPLAPGSNTIVAVARSAGGLTASATVNVTYAPPSPPPPKGGSTSTEAGISTPSIALIVVLAAALAAAMLLFLRERQRRRQEHEDALSRSLEGAPPGPPPTSPP